ncbi:MAG: ComF family protein [Elusimicrobia bacterium]|nr:ComF family protein [Elusimicrobiota bacterium]
MGFPASWRSLLLHWVFPQTCCSCKEDLRPGRPNPLCRTCLRELRPAEPPWCRRCGDRIKGDHDLCQACAKRTFSCGVIRPAFFYGGTASTLVHGFKYRGRLDAAAFCGRMMALALPQFPELAGFDCLAPVPLHPSRMRERGYNQALLLAREIAEVWRKPVREPLSRSRATKPQWGLGRGERGRNVSGGIRAEPGSAKGLAVLLVDDVCTTGATLEECAGALREAGAESVSAFVFARQALT